MLWFPLGLTAFSLDLTLVYYLVPTLFFLLALSLIFQINFVSQTWSLPYDPNACRHIG